MSFITAAMKNMPSRHEGLPLPSSSLPTWEASLRKRGADGETAMGDATVTQKKARQDPVGSVGKERASTSYAGSGRRGGGERNAEEFDRRAREQTLERTFSWERRATNHQQQAEGGQERQQTQELPAFDTDAAMEKLSQTKEYCAQLCRNYLARYKTQGADISFPLCSSTPPCSTDSRNTKCPEKERKYDERNTTSPTASFSAAARPPPSNNHYPYPDCEYRRIPSNADIERNASIAAARPPPSNVHQPPPECKRMPSDFETFLKSVVLQLGYDPSNASYREEVLALESRTLLMLDLLHQKEQQTEGDRGGGHGECDGNILCKARASKCDAWKLSQFRSYQFAFKAAAVAEIVRLKTNLIKSRIEVAEMLCNDTLEKGFSDVRTRGELVTRLKLENESVVKELAHLRAEKTASEKSFAEIQGVNRYLESQILSCTCKDILSAKETIATTRSVTAVCELKPPALNVVVKQQRRQLGDLDQKVSRFKAMGGYRAGLSAEDEARLELICEASVQQEVEPLIVEKLDALKAEMVVFTKTVQSRVACVAGKINTNEIRVGPVKAALFCLRLLIDKLQAKRTEILASLVENSPDNRLGLKLHFRS